jgi:hypothetical protein
MYCNVLYYQYCCQYWAHHQYYNIIISQPEILMTHSVSTNMQCIAKCQIMNSVMSILVINMPLQNPQLFIYLAAASDPGIHPFSERGISPVLKRTHN